MNEYARETPLDAIDLQPGERRVYWEHYTPDKWYKQAMVHGKLAVLLLDTAAEVSILDTTFARECNAGMCGHQVRNVLHCGEDVHQVTLAGNVVYYMDRWVRDHISQHAIFGLYLQGCGMIQRMAQQVSRIKPHPDDRETTSARIADA
ncbi:Eukaryotic/viral aspartic protease [Phytophthora megakarya]|uniref:Eukaryotic/viral aspartic protease n=1 Tax=Phytophthora megakarya TaxID=4795 RepID=A0A225WFS8_9STRA|nr:Eukaryotic/viral aspartic protease [Phytophthora megakarya]